jgi:hypothetical protein
MDDLLGAIHDTPLPTILVVAGVIFWVLAVAGSIAGKVRVEPGRQRAAGVAGTILIALGLVLYIAPGHRLHQAKKDATANRDVGDSRDKSGNQKESVTRDGGTPFADTVKIRSISPRPQTRLRQSADIQLELLYSLFSADKAILAVYLEEFPENAGRCDGAAHQTNGGIRVPVARGEHVLPVTVHWPGNSAAGFLTVGANIWRDVDGQPVGPPTDAGLFREFCFAFGADQSK